MKLVCKFCGDPVRAVRDPLFIEIHGLNQPTDRPINEETYQTLRGQPISEVGVWYTHRVWYGRPHLATN